jgi:nucleotide-binding universal stress UspA family protein
VETLLKDGDAAAEIVRMAEESVCDLIVMGTHGRSWLDRLRMGSVSEAVLPKACYRS